MRKQEPITWKSNTELRRRQLRIRIHIHRIPLVLQLPMSCKGGRRADAGEEQDV
jgi:hypothetical protein